MKTKNLFKLYLMYLTSLLLGFLSLDSIAQIAPATYCPQVFNRTNVPFEMTEEKMPIDSKTRITGRVETYQFEDGRVISTADTDFTYGIINKKPTSGIYSMTNAEKVQITSIEINENGSLQVMAKLNNKNRAPVTLTEDQLRSLTVGPQFRDLFLKDKTINKSHVNQMNRNGSAR